MKTNQTEFVIDGLQHIIDGLRNNTIIVNETKFNMRSEYLREFTVEYREYPKESRARVNVESPETQYLKEIHRQCEKAP